MRTRICFFLLVLPALAAAQTAFSLDSIKVEGNRVLTVPGILAASQLKTGVPGGAAVFDAARDRLLATGYFETVGYQFRPSSKGGIDLTLEVQEMQPLYAFSTEALPVTVEEISAWLKSKDPLFTGRMPGTAPTLDRASLLIEQLLDTKKAPLKVDGKVIATGPNRYIIQFMPATGLPRWPTWCSKAAKRIR